MLEKRIRTQPLLRREALARIEAQLAQRLTKEGLRVPAGQPGEVAVQHLQKMRAESKSLRPDDRRVRLPHRGRLGADVLPRARRGARGVQADGRALQGLHRDPARPTATSRCTRCCSARTASPIEVQIRTEDMDRDRRARHRRALELQARRRQAEQRAEPRARVARQPGRNASARQLVEEFLESVKVDLFPDKVYVFTPKGEILSLPRGATALDFAYAVHTDVGNRCVAARVDKKLVPLRTQLRNGQTVEIITAKSARAEAAVAGIRRHRQGAHRDPPPAQEPAARGRGAARPSHARSRAGGRWAPRSTACRRRGWMRISPSMRYPRLEALLADIALGNRMPAQVAQALARQSGGADRLRRRCASCRCAAAATAS